MFHFVTSTYKRAVDIPPIVMTALHDDACSSNVIYAQLSKIRRGSATGHADDLWIAVWVTDTSRMPADPHLSLLLSCTHGSLGAYPIFIFASSTDDLINTALCQGIEFMSQELLRHVSPNRVFSVFAPDAVADAFVDTWTRLTGIQACSGAPYYHAYLQSCDQTSLGDHMLLPIRNATFTLRPAMESDTDQVAKLCYEFAATSVS